jgi:hypothetical protein
MGFGIINQKVKLLVKKFAYYINLILLNHILITPLNRSNDDRVYQGKQRYNH